MKRFGPVLLAVAVAALAAALLLPSAASAATGRALTKGYNEPVCQNPTSTCADVYNDPEGEYFGHDEPSVAFKSGVPGSGNNLTYQVTLPTDPTQQPTASGASGSTWNFQLRATFWLGLTLCDTESAPEFTNKCTPDSDANDLEGTNPKAKDYIGRHPGNAFLELQFYEPGYVPQFEGFGCTATQYCAAMTIDSLSENSNTGVDNNAACDNFILGGVEPVNWAYVTRNGVSQAPANPLFSGTFDNPNFAAVNPDPTKDLMMNPGDVIRIHMHDTTPGYRVDLTDLSTGQHGSMTASTANGFGHILYRPGANKCKEKPYAFHAEYSTANPRGNTWSAHGTDVSVSDEIGHFENCLKIDANFNCTKPGAQDVGSGLDEDDGNNFCVPGTDSLLVMINGCFSDDEDFDGQSYRADWPGTIPNATRDQRLHPTPLKFTSPLINGRTNMSAVEFEADLPRIEASDSQDNPPFCNRATGAHCVNPPMGAQFYPFYSTGTANGTCVFQQGGDFIPGTTNDFGGSSTSEYGPLLKLTYPDTGFTTISEFNDFNSGPISNPCPNSTG